MKVDVLTIDDVVIKKFRWWSNWIDICVFDFGGSGYLLQMAISRTNKKRFRAAQFKDLFGVAYASTHDAGCLTKSRKVNDDRH